MLYIANIHLHSYINFYLQNVSVQNQIAVWATSFYLQTTSTILSYVSQPYSGMSNKPLAFLFFGTFLTIYTLIFLNFSHKLLENSSCHFSRNFQKLKTKKRSRSGMSLHVFSRPYILLNYPQSYTLYWNPVFAGSCRRNYFCLIRSLHSLKHQKLYFSLHLTKCKSYPKCKVYPRSNDLFFLRWLNIYKNFDL